MTLDELTPWLFARTSGGIRWGLDRTERLLAGVGNPHRLFHSILIGGTNGKGSTAAFCESVLRVGGRSRIGLYTSPHLVSFTERIRIDGEPVADAVLAEAAARLRPAIEEEDASFFEATTALAFLIFAEAGVDLAVVEVGLGGRLDATNVLLPLVTAVTNVDRDHVEYLGEDLTGIAREKAGIFKPGVSALIGEASPELKTVLEEEAARVGAPIRKLDELASAEGAVVDLSGSEVTLISRRWGERRLHIPLPGKHQIRNAMMAVELVGLLPDEHRPGWAAVERGVTETRWPGRLQLERVRGTRFLLDVAHNPAGVETLAAALDGLDLPRPRVLVVAVLGDKDWRAMLPPLVERTEALILTHAPSAPRSRRWDPEAAAGWIAEETGVVPRVIEELGAALDRAVTLAPHGTVIVAGSVHTVGDALKLLGLG